MALSGARTDSCGVSDPVVARLRETVVHGRNDVTLHVVGELDVASAGAFAAAGVALWEPAEVVWLDLSGVTFLDCAGLSSLLRLRRTLEARSLRVAFVNPSRPVRRLFDLAGVATDGATAGRRAMLAAS